MTNQQAQFFQRFLQFELADVRAAHEVEFTFKHWLRQNGSITPAGSSPQPEGAILVGIREFKGRRR
jgi:hypothetical protein